MKPVLSTHSLLHRSQKARQYKERCDAMAKNNMQLLEDAVTSAVQEHGEGVDVDTKNTITQVRSQSASLSEFGFHA